MIALFLYETAEVEVASKRDWGVGAGEEGEMVASGRDLLEAKSNVRATHILNIDNQYLHM
jgi:hypothetical protein